MMEDKYPVFPIRGFFSGPLAAGLRQKGYLEKQEPRMAFLEMGVNFVLLYAVYRYLIRRYFHKRVA